MSASVKITGLKEIQAYVSKFSKNIESLVDKTVEAGVREMVLDAKKDAPKDHGFLTGQITAKKNTVGDWSMISGSFYSPYLEFGTKGNYKSIPGVDASQFKGRGKGTVEEFYKNLIRWVDRKGIAASWSKWGQFNRFNRKRTKVSKAFRQKENEEIAMTIMLSILAKGIKPHPFFFKQGDKHGPRIIQQIESLMKKAVNG